MRGVGLSILACALAGCGSVRGGSTSPGAAIGKATDFGAEGGNACTTDKMSGFSAEGGAFTSNCTSDGTVCTVSPGVCVGRTRLEGRVFDPAGKNPVYGAVVWVPYTTPDPMPAGLVTSCAELYFYTTGGFVGDYAVTDPTGAFALDAPAAKDGGVVPLVVQLGKWRYQKAVAVTPGQTNLVPDGVLRLPQGRTGTAVEFAGDLPNLAVSTGGEDTLECLFTRVGVAADEYTPGAGGPGRLHIFQGSPATAPTMPGAPQSSAQLWDTVDDLANFDAVFLSCEGAPTTNTNPWALVAYGRLGGRAFLTHYHYTWFIEPPFPALGTWYTSEPGQPEDPSYAIIPSTVSTGVPFPLGEVMQAWLQNVGALDSANELEIHQARHNVNVTGATFPQAIPWIKFDPSRTTWPSGVAHDALTASSTLYFSYDIPVPSSESGVGRVVYSDIHVGRNSGDYGEAPDAASTPPGGIVPSGCNANADLSPQEKALEFLLFELSSVQMCLAQPAAL